MDAINRKTIGDHIDAVLIKRYEQETDWWNQVGLLKRLVTVLKLKLERDLSISGKYKIIGYHHKGNYLRILELLGSTNLFWYLTYHTHANKEKASVLFVTPTCK